MDDKTRRQIHEAQDAMEKDTKMSPVRKPDLEKQYQFAMLDEVFTSFLETNKCEGLKYNIKNLLAITESHKHFFRYEHASIPYLATVFIVVGPDSKWINLKLCNNGFVYQTRRGETRQRHNAEFMSLGEVFDEFEGMQTELSHYFKKVAVFYSNEGRMDIKFSDPIGDTPNLIVTYEPGYPYWDDKAATRSVSRQS